MGEGQDIPAPHVSLQIFYIFHISVSLSFPEGFAGIRGRGSFCSLLILF